MTLTFTSLSAVSGDVCGARSPQQADLENKEEGGSGPAVG